MTDKKGDLLKLFICWSGERGETAALALSKSLPLFIQDVEPFMSTDAIRKGANWSNEIASRLSDSEVGVVCLTSDSLKSEWIHFESGALSNKLAVDRVMTLLIDVSPSDIGAPLAQFQATKLEDGDFLKFLETINQSPNHRPLQKDVLQATFDTFWPKLFEELRAVAESPPPSGKTAERDETSILEELVEVTRDQSRMLSVILRNTEYQVPKFLQQPTGGAGAQQGASPTLAGEVTPAYLIVNGPTGPTGQAGYVTRTASDESKNTDSA